ncbi:hypothetical protein Taro_039649, partial [Colocasia esculenta]|nr:hypothetical protein [Colocasia esculenta]
VMVEMSKEGGGQEVKVMSTKKEKGGEEHEEIFKKKEEGEEDEKKEVNFLKKCFLQLFVVDTTEWPIVVPSPCPQQGPGDDCALFVCKYMECLSQKSIIGFPFSQADMDIFRGKLAWAIIQEVNEQKAQEMTCEQAVEKDVSLLDDT